MPVETKLITKGQPLSEFFRDLVKKAIVNLHLKASEIAEFYIVNLLHDFSRSENLYESEENKLEETPLALLLERAIHTDVANRIKILKYMGDVALYIAGFFPLYVHKKSVNIDYYMNMGGGAYLTLSRCMPKAETFGELYGELGEGFEGFVSLLAEVNTIAQKKSNLDILKLYERWLETGDERLEELLKREGICASYLKTEQ